MKIFSNLKRCQKNSISKIGYFSFIFLVIDYYLYQRNKFLIFLSQVIIIILYKDIYKI